MLRHAVIDETFSPKNAPTGSDLTIYNFVATLYTRNSVDDATLWAFVLQIILFIYLLALIIAVEKMSENFSL